MRFAIALGFVGVAGCQCSGGPLIVEPDDVSNVSGVLLVLHGGGGNPDNMRRVTCPDGDVDSDRCLDVQAAARGYVVLFPEGHPNALAPDIRTWNAGGGEGEYVCVSGVACEQGVDSVGALRDELDLLRAQYGAAPVFATGISNGGAMAYRLACELSDRMTAIAPVAAGNQLAAVQGCAADDDVALLHIHGTLDPSWPFLGGVPENDNTGGKEMVAVLGDRGDSSVSNWAAAQGCDPTPTSITDDDPTTPLTRSTFSGCRAPVELLRIDGAGHTWPQGWQYFAPDRIGAVAQNVDANQEMLDFFDALR